MDQLKRNIGKAITKARKSGITGMSLANLKQVTPTDGLTISVEEYHSSFDALALKVAASRRFRILH